VKHTLTKSSGNIADEVCSGMSGVLQIVSALPAPSAVGDAKIPANRP
jgi:hypothetical protein